MRLYKFDELLKLHLAIEDKVTLTTFIGDKKGRPLLRFKLIWKDFRSSRLKINKGEANAVSEILC